MPMHYIIALNRQEAEHYSDRKDYLHTVVVTTSGTGLMRLDGMRICVNDTVDLVGQWYRGSAAVHVESALRSRGWTGFVLGNPVRSTTAGVERSHDSVGSD